MINKLADIGKIALLVLVFLAGFLLVTLPSDKPLSYEVHGADGTIYHTKSISHGTNRIWFTDENGNRIELGGGYSVIEK